MASPHLFIFTPVPLRARNDGWAPDLQLRFVEALAAGANPGEAARRIGKNRQNAYALRKRPGAESFAAAWEAAVAHARLSRAESAPNAPGSRRVVLPRGPRAEAAVELGRHRILNARSPAAARAALTEMLDALYGPRRTNSDNSDKSSVKTFSPGGPHILNTERKSVAFR